MNSKHLIIYFLWVSIYLLIPLGEIFGQTDSSFNYSHSLIELSKLQITSKKKENQNINNTPATVRVITKEQIKRKGYFTLEDALVDLPGFQFRNIMGINSYSFLRGLARQNNTILVLIDGVQINELNSGGFYGGAQYNLANVERIEVQYGPASVLYGTNAISGVINILTKMPNNGEDVNISMGIGNFSTYLSDITYSHAGKKMDLQLSGMYKSSKKADLTNANNDYMWDDDLEIFENDYSFDAKIVFNNIIAGINYQDRQSSTNTYYPSVGTIHKGYGTLWNLQFVNTYIKWRKELSENSVWQTTLYNRNATILGNSVKEVTDTGQIAYYRPNNQIGIESIIEHKVNNKIDLISGIFAYYEILANGYSTSHSNQYFITPTKPSSPEKTNNSLAGIFLEPDFQFWKYWQISPGIRLEYNSNYKEVLTPNASIIFNTRQFNSKLIYAQAFRAPKPWDFTDGEGNSGLQPELLNSIEFSNTLYLTENFKADFILYNNYLINGISKQYNMDQSSYRWVNSDSKLTNGAEMMLQYQASKFGFKGYYTFTDSKTGDNIMVDEIAKHTGFLGADCKFAKYLNAEINIYYFGKRKNPKLIQATQSEYIDPAIVANLYVSLLNYNNLDIQLILKNITNKEYYHTSNISPDRIRQPQFSVFIKLSYLLSTKDE